MGRIRQYHKELEVAKRIIDGLAVAGMLWFSIFLYELQIGDQADRRFLLLGLFSIVLFYVFAKINDVYQTVHHVRFGSEAGAIVMAWLGTVMALLLLGYATKSTGEYSRLILGFWLIATPCLLVGWRFFFRTVLVELRKRGIATRDVVIVGRGKTARTLAGDISSMNWTGLKLLGLIDDDPQAHEAPDSDENVLGNLETLFQMVARGTVDVVYVSIEMNRQAEIAHILDKLADSTVTTFLVPDSDMYSLLQRQWHVMGRTLAISMAESSIHGTNAFVKRVEDLAVASIGLIMTFPVLLVISLMVVIDSRGPVFFRQRRNGLDGREFHIWKFRTMQVSESGKFLQATKGDRRITRTGVWLRKTSLDELPQLFNVLGGSMSVVGPRPHAVEHNQDSRHDVWGYMLRHKVKPGITGLAQISGCRGETDDVGKMARRVQYDMEYINNWSLWLDIRIIIKTPWILIRGEAY